ncbi:MAG: CBS domain-containing protein [Lachnospiraceae bacterium]|nr:CBS domain-containing protein [Lachnospiraceae bacterium]
MNILFFLTPKSEVAYLYDTDSLRQALKKMESHRYSAIPIIASDNGRYVGTLTEGDLLWNIKDNENLSLQDAEKISVMQIKRNRDNEPVEADADMEDLINKAVNQNFVPVVDGDQCFIGIIKRKDIILYLSSRLATAKAALEEKNFEKELETCIIN